MQWYLKCIFLLSIDPVTMVMGVLSDVSKTHRLSLVFHTGSKSSRYRCVNPVDPSIVEKLQLS